MRVEDENLLEMLEMAVNEAVKGLMNQRAFQPFAYGLDFDNEAILFQSRFHEEEKAYEDLTNKLIKEAKLQKLKAIVLLQKSLIPSSFNIQGEQSIRVHVEHSQNRDEKIAARFLYIPYELMTLRDGTVEVKLSHPKPVAFPHEIFIF